MPSLRRTIPYDIIFAILRQLDKLDEHQTLGSCSQVCRLWYREAHRALASRSAIYPMDKYGGRHMGTRMTKWRGQIITAPVYLIYIVRLFILEGKFLDHAWLTAALQVAYLPRLRSLTIYLRLGFPNFSTYSPSTPLKRSLHLLELQSNPGARYSHEGVYTFIKHFPRPMSLSLNNICLDRGFHTNCDIAPQSVTIEGRLESEFQPWFCVLSRPSSSRAIHHLRLAFHHFRSVSTDDCVKLFRNLEHLEIVEFDFCKRSEDDYSSSNPVRDRCRFVQQKLAPALSPTIHTLRLHPPLHPWPISPNLPVCVALLKAMPTTLRHVEICATTNRWGSNKRFDAAAFAEGFQRLPHLQTVEVVMDEKDIWTEGVEEIAAYRMFLEDSLPDLTSRGVLLRLTSEVRVSAQWYTSLTGTISWI